MNTINATPPDGFPDQVIVQQDEQFAHRHPENAYYLRVKKAGNSVDLVDLTGAVCMAEARQMAKAKGFAPTHYTLPGQGKAYLF